MTSGIVTRFGPLVLLCSVVQMLRNVHDGLDVIVAEPLEALRREELRRLQDVLDLSAVHVQAAQPIDVPLIQNVWQGALPMKLLSLLVGVRRGRGSVRVFG